MSKRTALVDADAASTATATGTPAAVAAQPRAKRNKTPLFLPYGKRWINDKAKRKFYRKSRRIGITWYESFDAVEPRITDQVQHDYFYTGINLDMAREFIDYCVFFQRDVFGKVADQFDGQIDFDFTDADSRQRKLHVNTFNIRFPNGSKIVAMPSRPAALRGRDGDLGCDEIDFHEDQDALYKAGASVTKWHGRMRMWSSANGEGTLGERIVRVCERVLRALNIDPHTMPGGSAAIDLISAKARELKLRPVGVSLHRTTIEQAVSEGLSDLLNRVTGSTYTPESFLQECHDECMNQDHYDQEYGCKATSALMAALKYHVIEAVQNEQCGGIVDWPTPVDDVLKGYAGGTVYIGVDVARTANWTVFWIFEMVGDVLWTRGVYRLKNVSMVDQEHALEAIIRRVRLGRCTILKRGVGVGITDHMERKFGAGRVSGLDESLPNKVGMIAGGVHRFEDMKVRVPGGDEVKEKLHSIRETRTPGGQVTYTAPTSDDGSHGDEAMACFAAIDGANVPSVAIDRPSGVTVTPAIEAWGAL